MSSVGACRLSGYVYHKKRLIGANGWGYGSEIANSLAIIVAFWSH